MVPRIRIGLIGCGHISVAHARAYADLKALFHVIAVCDTNEQAAQQLAAELDVPHIFTDYHLLLDSGIVDAVDLCLPHYLHASIAITCLEAGVHVLVEKPLATTLEDADAMIEAAQCAKKLLMVGHNERYDPQYQEMKRIIDEGQIGTIFCVRADHNYDVNITGEHWLKNRQQAGGGVLIGSGSHRIDLMRWLVGEVDEVFCVQMTLPHRLESESCALVSLRFVQGAIGELACSWAVPHTPWYELMWLQGTRGTVYNFPEGALSWYTEVGTKGEKFRKIVLPSTSSFTAELRHFGESISHNTQPLTNGLEGRETLAVILAAYQSARENRPVSLKPLQPKGSPSA